MPDLFVATAEEEIACYSDEGRCAEPNTSHFIRTNVVVVRAVVTVMITIISKGTERNGKYDQKKGQG